MFVIIDVNLFLNMKIFDQLHPKPKKPSWTGKKVSAASHFMKCVVVSDLVSD